MKVTLKTIFCIFQKRHLYVEHKMLEEDMALKMAVHYTNPELDRCLKLADEIKEMAITPLMLKKHPDIVTTVRKMRRYVGPVEPTPGHEVVNLFFWCAYLAFESY